MGIQILLCPKVNKAQEIIVYALVDKYYPDIQIKKSRKKVI
jgi:hypothetical protein